MRFTDLLVSAPDRLRPGRPGGLFHPIPLASLAGKRKKSRRHADRDLMALRFRVSTMPGRRKTNLSQRHYKSFSNTQQIRSVSTVSLPGMRQKVGQMNGKGSAG